MPRFTFLFVILFSTLLAMSSIANEQTEDQNNKQPDEQENEQVHPDNEKNSKIGEWMQKLEQKVKELNETIKKNWKDQEFDKLHENIEKLKELGTQKLESLGIVTKDNAKKKQFNPANHSIREFKVENPEGYTILQNGIPNNFYFHRNDQREWYRQPKENEMPESFQFHPEGSSKIWKKPRIFSEPKDNS